MGKLGSMQTIWKQLRQDFIGVNFTNLFLSTFLYVENFKRFF